MTEGGDTADHCETTVSKDRKDCADIARIEGYNYRYPCIAVRASKLWMYSLAARRLRSGEDLLEPLCLRYVMASPADDCLSAD